MKEKARYRIKDQILKFILDSKYQSNSISEVSEGLKIDFHVIHTFADDLIFEGYLENRADIVAKKREWHGDKILLVTPKGQFFFREEGGFIKRYKQKTLKQAWMIVKIIAAITNAVVIIAVSIWAVYVAKNSNRLETEIQRKEETILKLNDEIGTLKIEISNNEKIKKGK